MIEPTHPQDLRQQFTTERTEPKEVDKNVMIAGLTQRTFHVEPTLTNYASIGDVATLKCSH